MNNNNKKQHGPKRYRYLINILSALLTVLFIWLLGFVLGDIGTLPGPDYEEIEKQHVDQKLIDELNTLREQEEKLSRQIKNQKEIQDILQTSTQNTKETMNQLLEMHRLNIEKGIDPTEKEQKALAESENLFLENQKKFQVANKKVAELSEQQREINQQIQSLRDQINQQKEPAQEEYKHQQRIHSIKVASFKLAFLIPMLFLAAWLVYKQKTSAFVPIFYAGLIATLWKTGSIMHQYFPHELFKYIAIVAAITVVLMFIIHLIKKMIKPKSDWRLKQIKEAYIHHFCPVCSFPIKRGPFKHAVWTSRGPRFQTRDKSMDEQEEDQSYICPACGEQLYESCESCQSTRPSLLPHCPACGNSKQIMVNHTN